MAIDEFVLSPVILFLAWPAAQILNLSACAMAFWMMNSGLLDGELWWTHKL